MKAIRLHFDTSAAWPCETPPIVDAEELLERAIALKRRWIRIDWDGVEVELPVEDDVMFLAMNYAELEVFLKAGQAHTIFLGDGLLVMTAEREGEAISMKVCHSPHIDRRFSATSMKQVDVSTYRQAWSRLMGDLLRQIQPEVEPGPVASTPPVESE